MSVPAASSLLRLLQEPVQNAVHEVRGLPGAEAAGQIHRFVDRHPVRNVGEQDLVGSQPQHVAVGDGHPPQAPVLGAFGQQLVQFRTMVAHAGQQRSGELDQHRVAGSGVAGETGPKPSGCGSGSDHLRRGLAGRPLELDCVATW